MLDVRQKIVLLFDQIGLAPFADTNKVSGLRNWSAQLASATLSEKHLTLGWGLPLVFPGTSHGLVLGSLSHFFILGLSLIISHSNVFI